MKLHANDKFVLIGDSITDTGRAHPVGEGRDAYGNGYVSLVNGLLQSVYPQLGVRVVNMGISGNTVRDLKRRWSSDVMDLKPDWVSVMIGTNDVWRQFDLPQMQNIHVYLGEYEETLNELVSQTLPHVKGMVLMTPFYLEENVSDPMRATMDLYGLAVKRVATAHQTLFVDTQAAFAPVLSQLYPAALAWDRVHPNVTGHLTLARALLNSLDFQWQ